MNSKIPIIDISAIIGPYGAIKEQHYTKIQDKLGDAMENVGFAYLINHGIDMAKSRISFQVENVYEKSRQFFSLPEEAKAKYKKQDLPHNFNGYAAPGGELLNESKKNSTELRELWDIWGPLQYKKEGFPSEIEGFKESFDSVRPELNNLGKKLLKCIAKYLKMEDEDFFIKRHTNLDDPAVKTQTNMRTMWYSTLNPNGEIPENAIRCGEHRDWGTITLLFQDEVGGLEVQNVLGEWIEATPVKNAILLNSGQLLDFWTGGHIHAAVGNILLYISQFDRSYEKVDFKLQTIKFQPHRVRVISQEVPSQKPRQSFMQFINPDADEIVRPVVPLRKGKENYAHRPHLEAYSHYERLITDATLNGNSDGEFVA